jgi:hypothetical protein
MPIALAVLRLIVRRKSSAEDHPQEHAHCK